VLLLAHRSIHGTLNPRTVSGWCWLEQCSPWPAPFSPQAPPKIALPCSSGSSIVWRGPTPPKRARPPCGFTPSRTGLVPFRAEALQRSPVLRRSLRIDWIVCQPRREPHDGIRCFGLLQLGSHEYDGSVMELRSGEWIRVRASVKLRTWPSESVFARLRGSFWMRRNTFLPQSGGSFTEIKNLYPNDTQTPSIPVHFLSPAPPGNTQQ
jgi:hypothetical protein